LSLILLVCVNSQLRAQMWDVLPTPLDTMSATDIAHGRRSIQAVLFHRQRDTRLRYRSAMALVQLGDRDAVQALIKAIDVNGTTARKRVVTALY
jgi:hypothetical protein